LADVAPFADLPASTLAALAEVTSVRHYRKDMYIFGEGEPAEMLCFVNRGAVKVFKTTSEGQEQTLHLLQPNELFAITGFVVGGIYPGTAQTLEDSWIGCIRNQALRGLAQRDVALAWSLLAFFARRLTGTSQQVLDLGTRDTAGRLAAALLQLAGVRDRTMGQHVKVGLQVTHRELAQLIGASRETVTRLLGEFRQEGSITQSPDGHLEITPEMLQRRLD
jgi:CRP/FNR family transcriptional regulator